MTETVQVPVALLREVLNEARSASHIFEGEFCVGDNSEWVNDRKKIDMLEAFIGVTRAEPGTK
jgi:hypothetical protein